jgi:hemoglobin
LVLTIPEFGAMLIGIGDASLIPSPPIPEGPERRAALSREVMEQTGLDPAVIERFVRAFYGAARTDPLLASAFAGVADWEKHIATITRFWCSVALMTGGYHGQPMQAHAHLALTPAHFARWLALFEQVATACLTPAGAGHMLDRARRIARSLEMGLIPLPLPASSQKGTAA